MPEYTSQTQKDPIDPDTRHVEILSSAGIWEPKTLIRGSYWIGGRGNVVTWKVEGTLEGYEPDELNALYTAGKLRMTEAPKTDKPTGVRVNAPKRLPAGYSRADYDLDEAIAVRREIMETTGKAQALRAKLQGLNDYKVSFENDERAHVHKLFFFRGASTFQGALPFYFDDAALARRKANLIASMTGIERVRGAAGDPSKIKNQARFQGSIVMRCKHSFEAKQIGREIAALIGHAGDVFTFHLGHAANRELNINIGVRDTKRRAEREERVYSRAS